VVTLLNPPAGMSGLGLGLLNRAVSPSGAKRLIVIEGQSNALGKGTASAVTNYAGFTDTLAAVQMVEQGSTLANPPIWQSEGPRDLGPRLTNIDATGIGACGIEISLMKDLNAALPGQYALAKFAISSSGLENQAINPAYPVSGGQYMDQLIAYIRAAETALGAELYAIIQVRGEADAGEQPDATNYETNLSTFETTLRTEFGSTFFFGVSFLSQHFGWTGGSAQVRTAQQNHVAASRSNRFVVFTEDIPFQDTAHFTSDGYSTLGSRFARELRIAAGELSRGSFPYLKGVGAVIVATSAQSLSPVWPPHETNDVGIMALSALGNTNYPLGVAAGFVATPDGVQHNNASSTDARLQTWEARASSSAMATPTISDVGGDNSKLAGIWVWGNVRTTGNSYDVTAGDTAATSTSVTIPGDTTTADNVLALAFCAIRVDSDTRQFGAFANASLANVTETINISTTNAAGFGLGMATGEKATAGTVDATTSTLSTTSTQARQLITLVGA
jgi:hypothetical protein